MTLRLLTVLVALTLFGPYAPARAQGGEDAPQGLAYASSFAPVPAGAAINVRPWDNTTDNQRVTTSFSQALTRRGIALNGRTALTLNFETEVESLAAPSGFGRESRVRMELEDKSLVGRRADGGSGTIRYILRATLDDQKSGQRLWQGEATYTGAVTDEAGTFAAMAPILVDAFGQNLRPKSFRIQ